MKKIITAITATVFLLPSISFASTLTQPQVNAIIALLQAFNVEQSVLISIQHILIPESFVGTSSGTNGEVVATSTEPTLSFIKGLQLKSSDSNFQLTWATNIPVEANLYLSYTLGSKGDVLQHFASGTANSYIVGTHEKPTYYTVTIYTNSQHLDSDVQTVWSAMYYKNQSRQGAGNPGSIPPAQP